MIDTILFDLDGTLLPMEQDSFISAYFSALSGKAISSGYEKNVFLKALWAGTKAMMDNDGSITNRERFMRTFSSILPADTTRLEEMFENFYRSEFKSVQSVVKPTNIPASMIRSLQLKNFMLILATNPLFPRSAVSERLNWINLCLKDFDLVTTYDICRYCKPRLEYYMGILEKAGREPSQCLMAGNNVREDMCAKTLGMDVFLVTEFTENEEGCDIAVYRSGKLEDLERYLNSLPAPV